MHQDYRRGEKLQISCHW